ncbi:MFS transporter [Streptomyces sp. NPDC090088]|uniref:MFS transporter n=1 Tax=Streptomyces sp. NPDC090088 TaxID=3365944 RepID=UPI00380C1F7C
METTAPSPPSSPVGAPAHTAPKAKVPPVVYLLGAVAFLMGTTEMIVAGLLPQVADGLNVSTGQAGLLVTVFAIGMIIGAPVMSMATLRLPRRATLVLALLVFALGHVVAAVSSSFGIQLAARFVSAVATGTFWAVGAVLAAAAAGKEAGARATAVMIGGLTLANVLGVPLGTAGGQALGWRGPFWVLAVLALLAAAVLARKLPVGEAGPTASVDAELASLRSGRLWLIYLACALLPGSFVAAYSYIAPLLTDRAGLSDAAVPLVMLGYGLATLAGTAFGGRTGDRRPFATAIPAAVMLAVVLGAITLWATNSVAAVVLFVLLGLFALVAQPILIAQVVQTAGATHSLAVSLSTSALNAGIASGSWLGGVALSSGLGLKGPSLLGALIAVLAAAALAVLARATRRS